MVQSVSDERRHPGDLRLTTGGTMDVRDGTLGLLVVVVVALVALAAIGLAVAPYIDRAAHILN